MVMMYLEESDAPVILSCVAALRPLKQVLPGNFQEASHEKWPVIAVKQRRQAGVGVGAGVGSGEPPYPSFTCTMRSPKANDSKSHPFPCVIPIAMVF